MEKFAVEVAKKAGSYLLKNFRKDKKLLRLRELSKQVLTKYDETSDKLIIKLLSKKYPDYNILTEESGFINKKSEFTWVVDSLDGSGNFSLGNPFFSVSIALLHLENPVFGVAYAPFLNELYVGEEGKGATLNGKNIHVSHINDFKKSYLVSCEAGEKNNIRISKINAALHPKVKDMRKLGSGAIESAWVGCGRIEGFVTTKISPWDIATGVVLVREAGGKVTNFKGEKWRPVQDDVVFSNGKVHNQILKIINRIQ